MKNFYLLIFICSVSVNNAQTLEWTKQFSGLQNLETLGMTVDNSGNTYTTGFYEFRADVNPGPGVEQLISNGSRDIFITKLDANGDFVWGKSIGGSDFDQAYSVHVSPANDIYVTGWYTGTVDFDPGAAVFNLNGFGSFDAFVLKLDSNGNFIWAKSIAGSSADIGYGVVSDNSGVYIAGRYQGTVDLDPDIATSFNATSNGILDGFIVKLDTSGNFIWGKSIGGVDSDFFVSLDLDTNSNVYALLRYKTTVDFNPNAGVFNLTSNGADDVGIVKLNSNGDFIWAKSLGGPGTEEPTNLKVDALGNVYSTGYFSSTADFNPDASVNNLVSNGSFDVFISKLDSNGAFVWAKSIGGNGQDDGRDIDVDLNGNVYVTGLFSNTVDFDPEAGIMNASSNGGNDIFLLKLDSAGAFSWATQYGSTGTDIGRTVAINGSDVYSSGFFEQTVDFDFTASTNNFTSAGSKDIYVQKISQNSLSVSELKTLNSFSISPNPTKKFCYVNFEDVQKQIIYSIYNQNGQIIKRNIINQSKAFQIKLPEQPGLYFLKISSDTGVQTRKILKL
jgi:hypothetical protein